MNNNKVMWGVIGAIIILGGGYLLLTRNNVTPAGSTVSDTSASGVSASSQGMVKAPTSGQGQVVFSITDAAVSMGNITDVSMTMSAVEVYSQANGWTSISGAPKTFHLLALNAAHQNALIASVNLPADTYTQLRFHVDKVALKDNTNAVKTATPVASEVTLSSTLKVKGNTNSSSNVDVLADQSFYTTTKGEYVFVPVLILENRSNSTISATGDGIVSVSGGTVDGHGAYGMSLLGDMVADFRISSDAQIDIVGGVAKVMNGATTNVKIVTNPNGSVNVGAGVSY